MALGVRVWARRFVPLHVAALFFLGPCAVAVLGFDMLAVMSGIFGLDRFVSSWSFYLHLGLGDERLSRYFDVDYGDLLSSFLAFLAYCCASAVAVRQAHRALVPTTQPSLGKALAHVLPFVLLGIASFLGIDLAHMALLDGVRSQPVQAVALTIALSAQAILASVFWLALPAVVVDGRSLLSALRRSRRLARGSHLPLFALVLLFYAVREGARVALANIGPFDAESREWALGSVLAFGLLLVTLKSSVLAGAYRDVCLGKEGPRSEELDEVFG